jgi:hypothetical protein
LIVAIAASLLSWCHVDHCCSFFDPFFLGHWLLRDDVLAELVLHLQSEEPLLRELDRSQDNTDLTPVHMLVSPRFPSLRGPL